MSVVAVVSWVGSVVDPGADVDVGGDVTAGTSDVEGAAQAPRKIIMITSANNGVLGFICTSSSPMSQHKHNKILILIQYIY